MKVIYKVEDITDSIIQYSDKYVKRVIINTKKILLGGVEKQNVMEYLLSL